ncbi:hypothetical protein [Magnetococcus sp. PR-3]|uniref:hypothetical protein n=1 Tax=Magnetococcus sp. PR-3 TaxID=3120355 RepID=UPI002FCDEEDB
MDEKDREALTQRYTELETDLEKAEESVQDSKGLTAIPENGQAVVQKMISLIYECSVNRVAAKSLVDKVLARLGE